MPEAPQTSASPSAVTTDKPQQFLHTLANGLTLVAEYIPGVRSAAMTFLVPAGAANDPSDASGAASILSDWLLRGAGNRDSRALSACLDSLGVQRGSNAEAIFSRFSASLLGKNLLEVLPIYADIVQRPMLPDDGFGPAKDLALQQLDAIEDEPAHKLSILIRQRHYDYPFGRPTTGDREQIEALTAEKLREDFRRRFTPRGAILSIAGAFEWKALRAAVEASFGPWKAPAPVSASGNPAPRGTHHVTQATNQVQIGLAYDCVPDAHPDSILVHTASSVLSGGMGARLFSEVREKQGLCYSIHAGYHSFKERAAIFGYAGTAPERAQRTLDSFLIELRRMAKGITQEELNRSQIMMKSRVIMQGESSSARAGSIASDFYHRGRTRTLDELRALIESITLDRVNNYLAANPIKNITLVTIGPSELTVARDP